MERRAVFLASIGALHAVACGGEPGEEYGETRAALSITPSLPIKSFSYAGTTAGSILKLTVQVLPALFLGTIKLVNGGPGASVTGSFKTGAPKLPGLAEVVVSAQLYNATLASLLASAKLAIELEYNPVSSTISGVYIENV